MDYEFLKKSGWHLDNEAFNLLVQDAGIKQEKKIIELALNTDLKDIGANRTPDVFKSNLEAGMIVLQIQKLKNVSVPKEDQDLTNKPCVYRFQLSDGHNYIMAVNISTSPPLNNVLPGNKLLVKAGNQIHSNYLLLTSFQMLGGKVDALADAFILKKSLSVMKRNISDAPPPFVPFQKASKIDHETKEALKALKQDHTSVIPDNTASMQQAAQDSNVSTLLEMGFNLEDSLKALSVSRGKVDRAITSLLGRQDSQTPQATPSQQDSVNRKVEDQGKFKQQQQANKKADNEFNKNNHYKRNNDNSQYKKNTDNNQHKTYDQSQTPLSKDDLASMTFYNSNKQAKVANKNGDVDGDKSVQGFLKDNQQSNLARKYDQQQNKSKQQFKKHNEQNKQQYQQQQNKQQYQQQNKQHQPQQNKQFQSQQQQKYQFQQNQQQQNIQNQQQQTKQKKTQNQQQQLKQNQQQQNQQQAAQGRQQYSNQQNKQNSQGSQQNQQIYNKPNQPQNQQNFNHIQQQQQQYRFQQYRQPRPQPMSNFSQFNARQQPQHYQMPLPSNQQYVFHNTSGRFNFPPPPLPPANPNYRYYYYQ